MKDLTDRSATPPEHDPDRVEGLFGRIAPAAATARDAADAESAADAADRAAALIGAAEPGYRPDALAAAQADAGQPGAAAATLESIATNGDLPQIYRAIASFKALLLQADVPDADPAQLRIGFEALASPGAPLRVLASEQLALLDLADGNAEAAIDRLQALVSDAEASWDLKQRAAQAIVALGGEPSLPEGPQG